MNALFTARLTFCGNVPEVATVNRPFNLTFSGRAWSGPANATVLLSTRISRKRAAIRWSQP